MFCKQNRHLFILTLHATNVQWFPFDPQVRGSNPCIHQRLQLGSYQGTQTCFECKILIVKCLVYFLPSPFVPVVRKNADWIKKIPYLGSVRTSKLDYLMVLPLIKPYKLVSFYSILFSKSYDTVKSFELAGIKPGTTQ